MSECKHRYEPTMLDFKPRSYWWRCCRCGKTISTFLRESK